MTNYTSKCRSGKCPSPASGYFQCVQHAGERVQDADAPQILPQVTVAAQPYNRMLRTIQKGKLVHLEMKLDVEFTKPDSSFNIIAEIPGTDLKDEIVMIGGHFDLWHAGTGATDNGSGATVCAWKQFVF